MATQRDFEAIEQLRKYNEGLEEEVPIHQICNRTGSLCVDIEAQKTASRGVAYNYLGDKANPVQRDKSLQSQFHSDRAQYVLCIVLNGLFMH